MTFLFIFLWMVASVITCGIMISLDPDEWGGEWTWLAMLLCIVSWPLAAVFGLAYFIFSKIGKLATFVAGFLDSFHKEE